MLIFLALISNKSYNHIFLFQRGFLCVLITFSAGPAVLPTTVIDQLQNALPEYGNTQLGLMEMSHRSKDFQNIHDSAKKTS